MKVHQISAWTHGWFSSFFKILNCSFINVELTSGNAKGGLKKAEEVLKTVQGWSEKEFPNKKEVLGNLHISVGNALMELGIMDGALEHHHKGLELAEQGWELEESTQSSTLLANRH